MSSTVIDAHAAPRTAVMDEEKISTGSLKFTIEGGNDLSIISNKSTAVGSCIKETTGVLPKISTSSSPGSLHSVATALTNLVKTSKSTDTDDMEQDDEQHCGGDDKSEDFEIPLRFTKSGRKRAVPFPLKLMKVLSQAEFSEIITWLPDGKSFTILKPKAFVTEILSQESGLGFKQAKYSSFTRKLHRWGFMRHYRGDEAGAFYHKLFMRDRLDLVETMTCNKVEPPKYSSGGTNSSSAALAETKKPVSSSALAAAKVNIPKPSSAPTSSSLPRASEHLQERHLRQAVPPLSRPMVSNANAIPLQRPSMPGVQSMADNLTPSERLNAAIEMEVARRLKDRITRAAFSRHALAMMQQQLMPQPPPASLPILRDSSGFDWNSTAAAAALQRRASNSMNMTPLSLNPLMLAKGHRPMLNHPGAGMVGFRLPNSMGQLPPRATFQSNIEGGKAA